MFSIYLSFYCSISLLEGFCGCFSTGRLYGHGDWEARRRDQGVAGCQQGWFPSEAVARALRLRQLLVISAFSSCIRISLVSAFTTAGAFLSASSCQLVPSWSVMLNGTVSFPSLSL